MFPYAGLFACFFVLHRACYRTSSYTHPYTYCYIVQRKSDRDPDAEAFIQQTVYGWYRQRKGLDAFINNFYADKAASISRSDNLLYTVFAYLAIFRLDEIGFQRFSELVLSQDPTKMFMFISYLFNEVTKEDLPSNHSTL